ncbi:zinc finger, CCHC-type containing protein [Tanacetum coccineum]
MTTSVGNNSVFRSFFEKQKLTRPNFIDWYRQLRLVLSTEDKEKYLEQPIPTAPDQPIPPTALATYNEWVKNQKEIVVMIRIGTSSDCERISHVQAGGRSILSLILVGLSKEYDSFVQNYNMHSIGKTVNELHAMLKLHEETLPKKVVAPALHAIRAGKVQKNKNKKPSKAAKGVQGKGKGRKAYANAEPSYAPKPKNPPPPKKDNPAKETICHHCDEVGHWRRNCPTYLTELLKKKQLSQGASTSGIFTIELYSFPSTSWVYDTGCGTYICNTTQGLRGSKKLNPGALSLYIGNGQRAAVEAIGNYHLCLPSGLVIVLNNCHYASSITRGIILVSRLYEDGFINRFELNNAISVSKNNVVYFSVIPRDGVYEIKIKKRIEKLQHDRLLNSTDIESLGKCVSCMSGKMARKPYSHQVERAKDLLGLIHTDVCGPFRIMSRQGANYFITFTDDFSRYGYVYLLKHKHEVFEIFKMFQKEVENQLGKTIKLLRFDRGVSERRNQTLLDMVCSMMIQITLPKSFWDYALEYVAHILNMVPTKKVDKTPYKIWHGQAPKLSYLKVWGSEALVKHDTLTKPDKLEPRSFKCIFIGYLKETMGYSFYNPSENKVFVAQNAEFFESNLIDQEASESLEDLEIIQEEYTNPSLDTSLNHEEDDQDIDEPQSEINPIRRSSRTKRAPRSNLAAMNVKMQSMKDNDVWELVELPPNAKTVGHKWLFKKKTDMEGAVYTFKSHLVAKGFTQTYGVDYEETFSPVADIRAIRILIPWRKGGVVTIVVATRWRSVGDGGDEDGDGVQMMMAEVCRLLVADEGGDDWVSIGQPAKEKVLAERPDASGEELQMLVEKVWKSIGYGVSMYWIRRVGDFLEHGYAVSSLMDMAYWSSEQ